MQFNPSVTIPSCFFGNGDGQNRTLATSQGVDVFVISGAIGEGESSSAGERKRRLIGKNLAHPGLGNY